MTADINAKFGAANQPITLTLNSLADDGARESTKIANNSNLYLDAFVQLIVTPDGAPTGDKNVLVYAYGSVDGGTTHCGGATGADAAYGAVAGQLIENAKLIGILHCDATAEAFKSALMSIAAAFGGILPEYWGIIVVNQLGVAINSSGNSSVYQGIYAQSS